jgi:hypothetical protein
MRRDTWPTLPACAVCGRRDAAAKVYQQDCLGYLVVHVGRCRDYRAQQVLFIVDIQEVRRG